MSLDSRSRWIALWVLFLGDLMIVLDGTIVNAGLLLRSLASAHGGEPQPATEAP